jgi:ribonuclease H / adenosylcobalamin/alpha-ribazole phosphatase
MGSLILVRHATTQASEDGVNLGQRTDAPLIEAGRALAAATGRALAAELDTLPHTDLRALSSSALRCRETARHLLDALGRPDLKPAVHKELLEIDYGAWEGLSAEECRRRDPELRAAWEADPFTTRTPDGESGSDVAARAFATLAPLEDWLADRREAVAIVVSHNHVVRLRLAAALGLAMRDYRRRIQADPGAYSIITFRRDGAAVRRVNVHPAGILQ